jgi:diphthamide biosynthesis protein 3
MSWGVYWLFYRCPNCGKLFKSGADTISEPEFGKCPACHAEGTLVGESGKVYPPDANNYEDTAN